MADVKVSQWTKVTLCSGIISDRDLEDRFHVQLVPVSLSECHQYLCHFTGEAMYSAEQSNIHRTTVRHKVGSSNAANRWFVDPAVAQVVRCWIIMSRTRFRPRWLQVIFVVDEWYCGRIFSEFFCLPLLIHTPPLHQLSRYSVSLQTGRPGFDVRQWQMIFTLTSVSRPALRPTQPPVQWVPGGPFPGAKAWLGRDADHSSHLVPRSRMSRSYTSLS
jgi:hypothetical protein